MIQRLLDTSEHTTPLVGLGLTSIGIKMDENITEYGRSCDVCQRNKVIEHKRFGLLEPLEVPMCNGGTL